MERRSIITIHHQTVPEGSRNWSDCLPRARLAWVARDPPASRCEALRAGGGQACAEAKLYRYGGV